VNGGRRAPRNHAQLLGREGGYRVARRLR